MTEQRLIELEIKMAYQEDLMQALNQVIADQQQQIMRLENTCRLLNEALQSVLFNNEQNKLPAVQEIPPHY